MPDETGKLHFLPAQRHALDLPAVTIRETMGVMYDVTSLQDNHTPDRHRHHNWFTKNFLFNQLESRAFAV